jgi:integrase
MTLVDVGRGLGLRQGECFGLSPDDIDWDHKDGPMVHVQRQIAMDGATLVWSGAKGEDDANPKDRWIELDGGVGDALRAHAEEFPPVSVTLPRETKDSDPETHRVLLYTRERKPMNRNARETSSDLLLFRGCQRLLCCDAAAVAVWLRAGMPDDDTLPHTVRAAPSPRRAAHLN